MIHDSQVVCPQCLAVCRYIDGALVVKDDSDAPYRHTASVDIASSKQESTKFCHSCGKKLPSGIKFCPYCGADLSAPFSHPKRPTSSLSPRVHRLPFKRRSLPPKPSAPRSPSSGSCHTIKSRTSCAPSHAATTTACAPNCTRTAPCQAAHSKSWLTVSSSSCSSCWCALSLPDSTSSPQYNPSNNYQPLKM